MRTHDGGPHSRQTDTIVIGAGLSGLTAAWQLHRQGTAVHVFDAGAQPGGLIGSQLEDGFLTEAGPHTFPGSADALMTLCRELKLTPVPASSAAKNRYLYLQDRLQALPHHPAGLLSTQVLSPAGKLTLLGEPFRAKTQTADISIADFITRRLGREAAINLADPFVSGIYAGDIEALSFPAVFPKLWAWEQNAGSLLAGARHARKNQRNANKPRTPTGLYSFPHGLQTLTQALAAALPPGSLQADTAVRSIARLGIADLSAQQEYQLTLANGQQWTCRQLVLAVPADVAATLLADTLPAATNELAAIPYNSLCVVHTGFARNAIPHPLDGFGFLVPRRENLPLLGCIWASSLFPDRAPADMALFANFIGGAHQPELVRQDPVVIEAQVIRDLHTAFHISPAVRPVYSRTLRYERAIPQYTLGHRERIARLETSLQSQPHLALCGNYLHGVSLNDCVQSGLDAIRRLNAASNAR